MDEQNALRDIGPALVDYMCNHLKLRCAASEDGLEFYQGENTAATLSLRDGAYRLTLTLDQQSGYRIKQAQDSFSDTVCTAFALSEAVGESVRLTLYPADERDIMEVKRLLQVAFQPQTCGGACDACGNCGGMCGDASGGCTNR